MEIKRVPPPEPPVVIQITAHRGEARVLWAALNFFIAAHPNAANRDDWMAWAKEIEQEVGGL